ncbi:MAG: hypothetical protein IIC50_23000 [Planctomycetes bacterium]|nr:hypothetical protein [Planctomycetota bacterium]
MLEVLALIFGEVLLGILEVLGEMFLYTVDIWVHLFCWIWDNKERPTPSKKEIGENRLRRIKTKKAEMHKRRINVMKSRKDNKKNQHNNSLHRDLG